MPTPEKLPTRFIGTVMISPERPAREIHQIVEAIVEQLTTMPGSDVSLNEAGNRCRNTRGHGPRKGSHLENAATLDFIDKVVS